MASDKPSAQAEAPAKRVLVVDDVAGIRAIFDALPRRLRARPVEMVTVAEADAAMRALDASRVDLVVADYRLEPGSGLDVLDAALQRQPWARRVLMTGYNEIPAPEDRLGALGLAATVQKPFRMEDLLALVDRLLLDEPAPEPGG